MPSFYDMLRIIDGSPPLSEIAVSPDMEMPAASRPQRGSTSRLEPDVGAQRVIPLMVRRMTALTLRGLGIPETLGNNVIDRMVDEDEDPSNPMLLSYVSNVELKSLATLASHVLKWSVSKRNDPELGPKAKRLGDVAEQMFDAIQRAQEQAVNGH